MGKLTGQAAIVLGASSGMGRATALAFAKPHAFTAPEAHEVGRPFDAGPRVRVEP